MNRRPDFQDPSHLVRAYRMALTAERQYFDGRLEEWKNRFTTQQQQWAARLKHRERQCALQTQKLGESRTLLSARDEDLAAAAKREAVLETRIREAMEAAEQRMETAQLEIDAQRQEIVSLKDGLADRDKALSERAAEADELRSSVTERDAENAQLALSVEAQRLLQQKLDEMRQKSIDDDANTVAKLEQIKSRAESAESRIDELETVLHQRNEDLEASIAEAIEISDSSDAQREQLKSHYAAELARRDERYEQTISTHQSLTEQNEQLRSEFESLSAKMSVSDAGQLELESRLAKLNDTYQAQQQHCDLLQGQLLSCESQLTDQQMHHSADVAELQSVISALENELEQIRGAHQRAENDWNQRITQTNCQLIEAEQVHNELQEALRKTAGQIQLTKEEAEKQRLQLEQEFNANHLAVVGQLQQTIEEKQTQLVSLETVSIDWETSSERQQSAIQQMREDNKELATKYAMLKMTSQKTIAKLRDELATREADPGGNADEVRRLSARLSRVLSDSTNKQKLLYDRIALLHKENGILRHASAVSTTIVQAA